MLGKVLNTALAITFPATKFIAEHLKVWWIRGEEKIVTIAHDTDSFYL